MLSPPSAQRSYEPEAVVVKVVEMPGFEPGWQSDSVERLRACPVNPRAGLAGRPGAASTTRLNYAAARAANFIPLGFTMRAVRYDLSETTLSLAVVACTVF